MLGLHTISVNIESTLKDYNFLSSGERRQLTAEEVKTEKELIEKMEALAIGIKTITEAAKQRFQQKIGRG